MKTLTNALLWLGLILVQTSAGAETGRQAAHEIAGRFALVVNAWPDIS